MKKSPVNLLWTGGWDSTFRLLQLLLLEDSTGKEIDAMLSIRTELLNRYPETRYTLLNINFVDIVSIEPDSEITRTYLEMKKNMRINFQYEVLARFCKQIGVNDMELSIEAPVKKYEPDYLDKSCVLFSYFSFPLIEVTKQEMLEVAENNGWSDIMNMTWFCRRPVNGNPCGFCGPCHDVIEAGLGERLPVKARLIGLLQLKFRRYWRNNYHKQNKGILKYAPSFFKGHY
jgi:hypothetical protein